LIIGSAHLDVIGEFEDFATIDKEGKVVYSIGGTAYNISVNLAQKRLRCFLFTYLKKTSIITKIIWGKLAVRGVKRKYVHRVVTVGGAGRDRPILSESGFVAHRDSESKDISSAVTRTAITDVTLSEGYQARDRDRLRKAIRRASCVVADCNLSSDLLEKIIERAREDPRKIVIVPVVSESKIHHLINLPFANRHPVYLVAGNVEEVFTALAEYKTAKKNLPSDTPVQAKRELANEIIVQIGGPAIAKRLCDSCHCEFVSVSWGDQKCQLMTSQGQIQEIPGLQLPVSQIVTRTGAGDAWTSALVHEIFQKNDLDLNSQTLQSYCHDYLGTVLREQGATVGSTLALDEEEQNPPQTVAGKLVAAVRRWVIVLGIEHAWGALLLLLAGGILSRALSLFPVSKWLGLLPSWLATW
jgi:sugar/nucleoside kinase (ribokinase family)